MGNSKAMTPEESEQILSVIRESDNRPKRKSGSKSKSSSRSKKCETLELSEIEDIKKFVLSLKDGKEGEEMLRRFVEKQSAITIAPPENISIPLVQRRNSSTAA